jgi:hypothetical protein
MGAAYDMLREHPDLLVREAANTLERIATTDYRGPRPSEQTMAEEALGIMAETYRRRQNEGGAAVGDGQTEVRGVIAMNGYGQLCFFPTSKSEGHPIVEKGLMGAIIVAPARRKTHAELERLDP